MSFGGVATICGTCSHRWILSPASARSWHCPRCRGKWGANVAEHPCACGHPYANHRPQADVGASRVAFGISLAELDALPEILAREAAIPAWIGSCELCTCERFTAPPP